MARSGPGVGVGTERCGLLRVARAAMKRMRSRQLSSERRGSSCKPIPTTERWTTESAGCPDGCYPPIGARGLVPQKTSVPSIPMIATSTRFRAIDFAVAVPTPTGPPLAVYP